MQNMELSTNYFGWSLKNHPQIFTPPSLGKKDEFYGYINQKQIRSVVLLAILIKNRSLEIEKVINELIIDAIIENKIDLKKIYTKFKNHFQSFKLEMKIKSWVPLE